MRLGSIWLMAGLLLFSAGALQASGAKMTDLEKAVQTQKVIETVNRLFILTDRRDWPQLAGLFADRVHFDMTSMGAPKPQTLSPGEITSAWDQGLKPLKAIHHQAGNYLVSFDGGGAQVFCYGIASHYLPNKSGGNVRTFVGSYDLHLSRYGHDWRIDMFKFNLKYMDGNPDLEGK